MHDPVDSFNWEMATKLAIQALAKAGIDYERLDMSGDEKGNVVFEVIGSDGKHIAMVTVIPKKNRGYESWPVKVSLWDD